MDKKNDWVRCPSKRFPGKFYNFNVATGEAAWSLNELETKPLKKDNDIPKTSVRLDNYPEPNSPPVENVEAFNADTIYKPRLNCNSMMNSWLPQSLMFNQAPVYSNFISQPTPYGPNVMWMPIPLPIQMFMPSASEIKQQMSNQESQTQEFKEETLVQATRTLLTDRFLDYHNTNKNTARDFNYNQIKDIYCYNNDKKSNTLNYRNKFPPIIEMQTKDKVIASVKKAAEMDKKASSVTNPTQTLDSSDLRLILLAKKRNLTEYQDISNRQIKGDKRNKIVKPEQSPNAPKNTVSFHLATHDNSMESSCGTSSIGVRDVKLNTVCTDQRPISEHVDIQTLKSLRKAHMTTDNWFIVVDLNVLLSDFEFIDNFVRQDEECCLAIPYAFFTVIKGLSTLNQNASKPVQSSWNILKRLMDSPRHITQVQYTLIALVLEPEQNGDVSISKQILDCCFKLLEKNFHVVLVTTDTALLSMGKTANLHCYMLQQIDIKHSIFQNNTKDLFTLQNEDDLTNNCAENENLFLKKPNEFQPFYVDNITRNSEKEFKKVIKNDLSNKITNEVNNFGPTPRVLNEGNHKIVDSGESRMFKLDQTIPNGPEKGFDKSYDKHTKETFKVHAKPQSNSKDVILPTEHMFKKNLHNNGLTHEPNYQTDISFNEKNDRHANPQTNSNDVIQTTDINKMFKKDLNENDFTNESNYQRDISYNKTNVRERNEQFVNPQSNSKDVIEAKYRNDMFKKDLKDNNFTNEPIYQRDICYNKINVRERNEQFVNPQSNLKDVIEAKYRNDMFKKDLKDNNFTYEPNYQRDISYNKTNVRERNEQFVNIQSNSKDVIEAKYRNDMFKKDLSDNGFTNEPNYQRDISYNKTYVRERNERFVNPQSNSKYVIQTKDINHVFKKDLKDNDFANEPNYQRDISYNKTYVREKNEHVNPESNSTYVIQTTDINNMFKKDLNDNEYTIKSNYIIDISSDETQVCEKNESENVNSYRAQFKPCSVKRNASEESIFGFKASNESMNNILNEELKKFYVKNKAMSERIKTRGEEWMCCFTQVMENFMLHILLENTTSKDIFPCTLSEGARKIADFFKGNDLIGTVACKLSALYNLISPNGKLKANFNPDDLFKTIGCGMVLMETLKGLLPRSQLLMESEYALTHLLYCIEVPESDPKPMESENFPALSRCEVDEDMTTSRAAYVRNPSEVLAYLKNHFSEWETYGDEFLENDFQRENSCYTTNVVRTTGRHLNLLKINNCNELILSSDPECDVELTTIKKYATENNFDHNVLKSSNALNTIASNTDREREYDIVDNFGRRLNYDGTVVKALTTTGPSEVKNVEIIKYFDLNNEPLEENARLLNEHKFNKMISVGNGFNVDSMFRNIQDGIRDITDIVHQRETNTSSKMAVNLKPMTSGVSNDYSGMGNENCPEHAMIKNFLTELSSSLTIIYKFINESVLEIKGRNLREENKKALHNKTAKTYKFLVIIVDKLKRIIEREADDKGTSVKSLLIKAGVDVTNDKRVSRYKQVVAKCLEQANLLKHELKLLLDVISEN